MSGKSIHAAICQLSAGEENEMDSQMDGFHQQNDGIETLCDSFCPG